MAAAGVAGAFLWRQEPPARIKGKLLRTLKDHAWFGRTWFTPDGTTLVTSSYQRKKVAFWDLATGECLRTLEPRNAGAMSANQDGTRLVVAGDGHATLWDPRTGHLLKEMRPGFLLSEAVLFSPDDSVIAIAGSQPEIYLWSSDGERIARLEGHSARVWQVAFSPDSTLLASCGPDGSVRLWDAKTGKPGQVLTDERETISDVAFSPDGRWLASADMGSIVRVWDVATGEQLHTLDGKTSRLAFRPTGRPLLATSIRSGGPLRLWGHDRVWSATTMLEKSQSEAMAFSPDGSFLATGVGVKGDLALWDGTTGAELAVLTGHTRPVTDVAFNADATMLATVSADETVKVWSIAR
ncbi:WD40 repeat domain-containing protein [Nonomuraea turkmeniaca]|uniref:WD40 repeat domain-containing protein n=1 Tax=Nonomuraea turkmeniaca TaxID=103838 RepID=UPI0014777876|nr:WD40 repeat domain-containing protein [Nonomuraea turkmeniaca]